MNLFGRFSKATNKQSIESPREQYARKYINGWGIEIGALNQPLVNPNKARISYVDNRNYIGLCEIYPEIDAKQIIPPDIICSGDRLEAIADKSFDFVIANHVLEHLVDPLGALQHWARVLKPEGVLYCSVPDHENMLDRGRSLTTLNHLIEDHENRDPARDIVHYFECAYYWGKAKNVAECMSYVNKYCVEQRYPIHFHTFDKALLEVFFDYYMRCESNLKLVEDIAENTINGTKEYICVLKKILLR
ncbi:MAG: methyltransferase domain-containing protein [Acidobacteria bacterium]|nr:methyltransferase domain-containing protein [Acidobacteriota bacterium]MBI3423626.1 methyltransferase domain-containing protein [Acidobacteriota bacterium]